MLSIGIKASVKLITYAIYDNKSKSILLTGEIYMPLPKIMDEPQSYRFLRYSIIDIINNMTIENENIKIASIRAIEQISQNKNAKRIEIEGVIKESFASSCIDKYLVLNKKNILKKLDCNSVELEQLLKNNVCSDLTSFIKKEISNWDEVSNYDYREASLMALICSMQGL